MSWRRVHYRFGNVGLESPTQQAESVRHIARTISKSCCGPRSLYINSSHCRLVGTYARTSGIACPYEILGSTWWYYSQELR